MCTLIHVDTHTHTNENKEYKLLRESTKFIYVAHGLPPGEGVFYLSPQ